MSTLTPEQIASQERLATRWPTILSELRDGAAYLRERTITVQNSIAPLYGIDLPGVHNAAKIHGAEINSHIRSAEASLDDICRRIEQIIDAVRRTAYVDGRPGSGNVPPADASATHGK